MNQDLVNYLCDPIDRSELALTDEVLAEDGTVAFGRLISKSGRAYPIINGVPRFVAEGELKASVDSFGDEWNYFNYDLFKANWLNHVVKNTFGSPEVFKGKVIVDCGAGSGMQTRWMAELGARKVIALELSHSVDEVMAANLARVPNVDIVQCSIDLPALRKDCIDGMVICHNVIQHTPSVERTAKALWELVGPGGELVFNCYMKYSRNVIWMARWLLIYRPLRAILSRRSFRVILMYAKIVATLRFVPIIGWLLEKSQIVVRGEVPKGANYLRRLWKNAVLNTYDWYGSHRYQHQKTQQELMKLLLDLQPDLRHINNINGHFSRPIPPGTAFRIRRP